MFFKVIRYSLLLFMLLIITQVTKAQKATNIFRITGSIKADTGEPTGSVVTLTNLTTKAVEKSTTVNSSGKFDFDLTFFSEYKLVVVKENYYTKEIEISTMIPSQVWEKDSIFPPFLMAVRIYKKVPNVTLSFEGKVVGKLSYSPKGKLDNFDSYIYIDDKDIRREIDQAIKEQEDELFNQKMAEAVDFEKKNQIREAIKAYEEALAIRKNDQFIKPKLKELASDLKSMEKDALLEGEFNKLLASGDDNVLKQKYPEAVDNFKAALNIKPGNQVASDKLTNAEKLLAALNAEKAKLDAEFNRLLSVGDVNVTNLKYPEAIANYKESLTLKPGNSVATGKLTKAEQLLATANAEKVRLETEFSRLLASGDAYILDQKYAEAIDNFKNALIIKAGDKTASDKLTNAERLLAMVNADKAKQEAEFNRLLSVGDVNVKNQKYAEAIVNFKDALSLKPGNFVASDKLAVAEKLLVGANAAKAKLDADFARLLTEGDANVMGQKYPEAIENFKGALVIKAGDKTATDKLANAEKLLAAAMADKAKQEAEFNRLISVGDVNVTNLKYTDAITNFKDALNLKPGNSVATGKLANAEKLLAGANAQKARLEADFARLLTEGDANVMGQKYPEAIESFKGALAIRTGDKTASDKLTNAEKLLAAAMADKAKQEAEFNRLLSVGDVNVTNLLYPDAITNFKDALTLKPGNSVARDRLSNAEKLLADLNTEKARQESEFKRLLASGDANVSGQKYPEAIENFKGALALKTGDKIASDRLANAEKLLAAVNAEKASKEAEFNRLLTVGDENVTALKYPDAITNFKDALKIKAGDPVALRKLSDAEKLLAALNAEKAKTEAEFARLVSTGDANVIGQKYPEAIENFKGALVIKAGDKLASDKLANAEKLLAALNAEKAKKEAEFDLLLAAGNENMTGLKYPEAIVNFKDALKIKPGDAVASSKLSESEKLLALFLAEKQKKEAAEKLLADMQRKYKETIVRADQLFAIKSLTEAKGQYNEAIKISDVDKYPKERIAEIDSLLAKQAAERLLAQKQAEEQRKLQDEGSYLKNIQTGDANFGKSLWTVAIFYYQEALKYKATDKYAVARIDNCNKMIDSNITAERMLEYNSFIKLADADLQAKKYSSARFYYGKANGILPWENYPKGQLTVVDKLIATTDVNGIEAQYFDAIKKAEEAVTLKNIAIARFYFQKAISLKPEEEYPKQQLKRLTAE